MELQFLKLANSLWALPFVDYKDDDNDGEDSPTPHSNPYDPVFIEEGYWSLVFQLPKDLHKISNDNLQYKKK